MCRMVSGTAQGNKKYFNKIKPQNMLFMIIFLCCGDSTRCNLKILLNITSSSVSTESSFHEYQATNKTPVYFIYCGQSVKVTRYTLNECIA